MPSASGFGSSDALASVGRVAGHAPGGTSPLSRRNSVRKAGSGRAAGRLARGPSGEGRGCGRVVVVVTGSSHAGSVSRPVLRAGPDRPTVARAVGHAPPVPTSSIVTLVGTSRLSLPRAALLASLTR